MLCGAGVVPIVDRCADAHALRCCLLPDADGVPPAMNGLWMSLGLSWVQGFGVKDLRGGVFVPLASHRCVAVRPTVDAGIVSAEAPLSCCLPQSHAGPAERKTGGRMNQKTGGRKYRWSVI